MLISYEWISPWNDSKQSVYGPVRVPRARSSGYGGEMSIKRWIFNRKPLLRAHLLRLYGLLFAPPPPNIVLHFIQQSCCCGAIECFSVSKMMTQSRDDDEYDGYLHSLGRRWLLWPIFGDMVYPILIRWPDYCDDRRAQVIKMVPESDWTDLSLFPNFSNHKESCLNTN